MSEYIRVSVQHIRQDREAIQEEVNGIGDAVENLEEEMQALGKTWEGPAWQSFQKQMQEDIMNMRNICLKINEFISHMQYAEDEYRMCEAEVRELAEKIRL